VISDKRFDVKRIESSRNLSENACIRQPPRYNVCRMWTRPNSGHLFTLSMVSLVLSFCFFAGCLTYWRVSGIAVAIPFGAVCLFGGLANSLAFLVLHRMETAGYEVGHRRWFFKDLRLYSEYWRIAPNRGWSRFTLGGAILCFLLGVVLLFSIPTFAGHSLAR
jgi:hypothetical protein